jgi:hypothetical protein
MSGALGYYTRHRVRRMGDDVRGGRQYGSCEVVMGIYIPQGEGIPSTQYTEPSPDVISFNDPSLLVSHGSYHSGCVQEAIMDDQQAIEPFTSNH